MITTKTTAQQLVEQAMQQIETISVEQLKIAQQQAGTLVVDVRDIHELQQKGIIPNSVHMPRGMLEFWFDPQCQYYAKDMLANIDRVVFYCAAGARSALATKTIQDMGASQIAHLNGGFSAWLEAGERVNPYVKNDGYKKG